MPALDWKGKSRSGGAATVIGSVVVLPPNSKRIGATIQNDGANPMYVSKGDVAVVNTGVALLVAGAAYEINFVNPWYGAISVACVAAAQNICWTEDE